MNEWNEPSRLREQTDLAQLPTRDQRKSTKTEGVTDKLNVSGPTYSLIPSSLYNNTIHHSCRLVIIITTIHIV